MIPEQQFTESPQLPPGVWVGLYSRRVRRIKLEGAGL
jgi:hypothetical protein